jgi:hypothetical protein
MRDGVRDQKVPPAVHGPNTRASISRWSIHSLELFALENKFEVRGSVWIDYVYIYTTVSIHFVPVVAFVPSQNSTHPSRSIFFNKVLNSTASFAGPVFSRILLTVLAFNSSGYSM